jgi:hypothetical protein
MDKAWAGVDVGKGFHWAHVLDVSGRELLSRRVENDEVDILRLIDEALSLAEEVLWAVVRRTILWSTTRPFEKRSRPCDPRSRTS